MFQRTLACLDRNLGTTLTRRLTVSDAQHSSTLEHFVSSELALRPKFARLKVLNGEVSLLPGTSHARRLAKANNARLKPNAVLNAGDVVEVLLPRPRRDIPGGNNPHANKDKHKVTNTQAPSANDTTLVDLVLYKDQHILVINKPRGLPVQGGSKVQQCIADMLQELQFNKDEPPRLVHRLDKDTTGCLVLARTKDAATRMSQLFADEAGALTKKYCAIVAGKPAEPTGQITTGIVTLGVAPTEKLSVIEWHETDALPENKNSVKKAATQYTTLASQKHVRVVFLSAFVAYGPLTNQKTPKVSLLELIPTTGRKHQLRLHCAQMLGTPILGDYKYGPGCPKQLRAAFGNIKTVPMHLHLNEISIKDWYGEGKPLRIAMGTSFLAALLILNASAMAGAQLSSHCVDTNGSFCVSIAPFNGIHAIVAVESSFSGYAAIRFGSSDSSTATAEYVGWLGSDGHPVVASHDALISRVTLQDLNPATHDASTANLDFSFLVPASMLSQPEIACTWSVSNSSPSDSMNLILASLPPPEQSGTFSLPSTSKNLITPSTSLATNPGGVSSIDQIKRNTPRGDTSSPGTATQAATAYYCLDAQTTFCVSAIRNVTAATTSFTVYSSFKGWVGLGTGTTMDGSTMFIGWNNNNSTVVSQRSTSGHNPPSPTSKTLFHPLSNPTISIPSTTAITYSFTIPISSGLVSTNTSTQFIFAVSNYPPTNPSNPSSSITQHSQFGSFEMDLSKPGNATIGATTDTNVSQPTLVLVHGILMFLAWGILAPLGIYLARYSTQKRSHIAVMAIGVCGLTAAAIACVEVTVDPGTQRFIGSNHGIVGTVVSLVVVPVQVILGAASAGKMTGFKIWKPVHVWIGRVGAVLAVVNVYLGLVRFGAAIEWVVAYWVWVACVAVGFVVRAWWKREEPKVVEMRRLSLGFSTIGTEIDISDAKRKRGEQLMRARFEAEEEEVEGAKVGKVKLREVSWYFGEAEVDAIFEKVKAGEEGRGAFVSVEEFREKGFSRSHKN
ncbi:hypothetical protein HDU98_009367 [Podochytrium sp. JEL0797]|nr:hypothetical protein HDU98_009367 [Podochytrium sp. JEL0797]